MPWCITCGKTCERNYPAYSFKVVERSHKRISFIQYLRCKWKGHDCYFW